MNIIKTGPRFIRAYIETKKFAALKTEMEGLRVMGDAEGEKALIWKGQKRWVESATPILGLTYDVRGQENIPSPAEGPFMIYSNHQGYADIPATLWLMKDVGPLSYVAKEEWRKYGILRDVIEYSRSIFLDRSSTKEAVRALSEARKVLGMGINMIIFPEGTRSKGHRMGEFKPGAFKFAEKAGVPILPVTLDGSFKMWEETGSWQATTIKVTVHPLVHIEQMDKEAQKQAAKDIEETIRSAL